MPPPIDGGIAARQRAKEYDWQTVSMRLSGVYANVLQQPPATSELLQPA